MYSLSCCITENHLGLTGPRDKSEALSYSMLCILYYTRLYYTIYQTIYSTLLYYAWQIWVIRTVGILMSGCSLAIVRPNLIGYAWVAFRSFVPVTRAAADFSSASRRLRRSKAPCRTAWSAWGCEPRTRPSKTGSLAPGWTFSPDVQRENCMVDDHSCSTVRELSSWRPKGA